MTTQRLDEPRPANHVGGPPGRDREDTLPRLRVLWGLVRPHRSSLILGLVLGLGATASLLATPMAIKWVLDSLSGSGSMVLPVVILLGLLVIGALLGFWQQIVLGTMAEKVVLGARTSLIRRIYGARVDALSKRSGGELVTRVTSDTVLLREAASSSIVQIVNSSIALVGSIVLMAVLDWPILLVTLVAVIGVGIVVGILMPRIASAQQGAQSSLGDLGSRLEGGIRALRTIKVNGAERSQADRVMRDARLSARHSIRAVRIEAVAWTAAGAGIQLSVIAVLAIGAWRVSNGTLAVSTLVAFLLYAFQLVEPATELTMHVSQLQAGIAAAGRIRELESIRVESDDVQVTPGGTDGSEADGTPRSLHGGSPETALVRFVDVEARYDETSKPVVIDVDLDVPRRGHLAIVGPSGAGKTTIFSLMLRFLDPSAGHLLLDGAPYEQLSYHEVRSRFAYVEQDTPVVPGSVRDNLALGNPRADDAAMFDALAAVDLDQRVRALPGGLDTPALSTTLSGGERQRLALARALISDADILLLDEATAQLDGRTEAAIHEVISRVAQRNAVVTIAHRLSTVIDADEIVVLERGRIRARGTHRELLNDDELYRELVAALRISH